MSAHWTSPIHTLPPELLILVFSQYIEWYKDCIEKTGVGSQPITSLQTRKGPWLLSHVCGEWRQLVLSTAQFWSYIRINYKVDSKKVDKDLPRYTNLAHLQLTRSRDVPLSVFLEFHHLKSSPNWFALILDFCNVIVHCRHRWKVLEVFDYDCELVSHLTTTILPMECPILEHLVLHVATIAFESTPEVLSSSAPRLFVKDRCQSLRSVELHGPNTYFPTLPWAQLQRLHLNDVFDVDSYHVVFREMVNLQILELIDCIYNGDPPPVVIFPSLRILTLESTPDVFSWIRTPLLEDLSIDFEDFGCRKVHIAGLISFIQHSQCSIRTLQFNPTNRIGLDVSQLNFTLLPSLLQVLPLLQRLSLILVCGDYTDMPHLLEAFTTVLNSDHPQRCCPELCQLSLVCRENRSLYDMQSSFLQNDHRSTWESLVAHEREDFVSAMKARGVDTEIYCRGVAAQNPPTTYPSNDLDVNIKSMQ